MKRKLLVIGGSYMNLQMKIDPRSKGADITEGTEYHFHPYGDTAIAAIAAAKMGGDCLFATKFGDDTNGKRLYEYYKNCGMNTAVMRKEKALQTGMSVTVYSDLGTHETFLTRGASGSFTKAEVDEAFQTSPDLFIAPLEEIGAEEITVTRERPLPPKAESGEDGAAEKPAGDEKPVTEMETVSVVEKRSLALYAIRHAEERQTEMFLQYTPFTAKYPLENIGGIKALIISDEMLYKVTGFYPDSTEKTLRSLVAISQKIKAKYYIVTRGDRGVFVYDGKYYETYQAPTSMTAGVKADGAPMNQTFLGALAADYLESKNILHAARVGVLVSLLSKTRYGNLEKMITADEFAAYIAENGIKLG